MERNYVLNAIVLRSFDVSEADKKLTLLTLEQGRIFAVLKSVKKEKAKLKFAAAPFTYAKFETVKTAKTFTVTGCEPFEFFNEITSDYDKYIYAALALEAVEKSTLTENEIKEVFVLLLKALKAFAFTKTNPRYVLVRFLTKFLKVCGFAITEKNLLKMDTFSDEELEMRNIPAATVSHLIKTVLELYETEFNTTLNGKKLII